jgi:hypothetical protein
MLKLRLVHLFSCYEQVGTCNIDQIYIELSMYELITKVVICVVTHST